MRPIADLKLDPFKRRNLEALREAKVDPERAKDRVSAVGAVKLVFSLAALVTCAVIPQIAVARLAMSALSLAGSLKDSRDARRERERPAVLVTDFHCP